MARPPNIRIPGLQSRPGVAGGSQGVLIGRLSGRGPLQILTPQLQRQMGIRAPSNNQIAHIAGFTFNVNGLPGANEKVGQGAWSKTLTFHNDDPNNVVVANIGASGTPSFHMVNANTLAVLGQIQFVVPKVGEVLWLSDPYIHPAGVPMALYCPNPADATLAQISGRVVGYF